MNVGVLGLYLIIVITLILVFFVLMYLRFGRPQKGDTGPRGLPGERGPTGRPGDSPIQGSPLALMYDMSSNMPLTSSTITFPNRIFDTNNTFNGSTFTAPTAGVYNLTTSLSFIPSMNYTLTSLSFVSSRRTLNYSLVDTDYGQRVSYTVPVSLVAGDTVRVEVNYHGEGDDPIIVRQGSYFAVSRE